MCACVRECLSVCFGVGAVRRRYSCRRRRRRRRRRRSLSFSLSLLLYSVPPPSLLTLRLHTHIDCIPAKGGSGSGRMVSPAWSDHPASQVLPPLDDNSSRSTEELQSDVSSSRSGRSGRAQQQQLRGRRPWSAQNRRVVFPLPHYSSYGLTDG